MQRFHPLCVTDDLSVLVESAAVESAVVVVVVVVVVVAAAPFPYRVY